MVKLVGADPSGNTFVVTGSSGSVSGGPTQSNVTGIEGGNGPNSVTITNAPNLYDGISLGDGDDDVTMTGSTADEMELRDGDNTVSMTDSTLYGGMTSGDGDDDISLDGSTVNHGISTGGGNDTIHATGTRDDHIDGLDTGSGNDEVTLDNVTVNDSFTTGDGEDTVTGTGAQVNSGLRTGNDNDTITFSDGSVINNGVDSGDGDDTLSFTDTEISGGIDTDEGDDSLTFTDSVVNDGIETDSGNDRLSFTDTTVHGEVDTGRGADVIIIDGGVFNRGIDAGGGNDIVAITDDTIVWGGIDGESGTDLFVVPVGTVVHDRKNGTFTVEEGETYTVSSGNIQLPSGRWIAYEDFESMGSQVPCFTAGTLIATPGSMIPVEDLSAGNEVLTLDRGPAALEWVGQRRLCALELMARPNLRPVRIPAGALGDGSPSRDLVVSPQHRVLIDSAISERMTGSTQLLLPAAKLVGYAGIEQILPEDGVHYVHIMCHGHEIVFSNGCPTESLYLGRETIRALPHRAKSELAAIFPDMVSANGPTFPPARPFLEKRGRIRTLLKRHSKNRKPLQQRVG